MTPEDGTQFSHLDDPLDVRLRVRHEKFLALEEDVLSVLLILDVPEFFGTETIHETAVPPGVAVHAVWVSVGRE